MQEPLVSLISRFGACSARISGDRQTHRHRMTIVILTVHAQQGLMKSTKEQTLSTYSYTKHGVKNVRADIGYISQCSCTPLSDLAVGICSSWSSNTTVSGKSPH